MATQRKTKNPNNFEPIIVNGCLVEPNTVYEIVSKIPSNEKTPQVYHELKSVKERFPGVSNVIYLTQTDTGFFDHSQVFNRTEYKDDWDKRKQMADLYYTIFAEPMRNYISEIERIRIPTDDEFFDRNYITGYLSADIKEGLQLNTANPIDRFKLYIALIEGELCMKGKRTKDEKEMGLKDETDIFNQDAQYCFISVTENKSKKEETAEMYMEAAYQYGMLIRQNKDLLETMLSYINISNKTEMTTSELNTIYKTKIESNTSKFKEFWEMLQKYNENKGDFEEYLNLFSRLKSAKAKDLIRKEGNTLYFGELMLGSNIKSAISTFTKIENADALYQFNSNFI